MININYPCDEFSEKCILGLILIYPKESYSIILALDEEDFYWADQKNRPIYKAIRFLIDAGKPVDITSITSVLVDSKEIDKVGGVAYITSLLDLVTTQSSGEYYLENLKDKTVLRNMLVKMNQIIDSYQIKPIDNIKDFVTRSENAIVEITQKRRVESFARAGDVGKIVGDKIRLSVGNNANFTGYTTGYRNIDEMINGMNKGSLIIVAGRPGMGKSAIALNIAFNCARKENKAVAYFSLEMDNEMLVQRLFASRAGVPMDRIQRGFLDKKQREKLEEAQNEIQGVNLYLDGSSQNSVDDIIVKSKKLQESTGNLACIVIDHIGILATEKGSEKKSEQEIIAVRSRKLKQLAGELKIPVLCLSQLNRKTDERDNKMPVLSDLRSSGTLEQDADQVLLLYRKSYYSEQGLDTQKKRENSEENAQPGSIADQQANAFKGNEASDVLSVSVAKNRNGRTGRTYLYFFKEFGRFDVPTTEDLIALAKTEK